MNLEMSKPFLVVALEFANQAQSQFSRFSFIGVICCRPPVHWMQFNVGGCSPIKHSTYQNAHQIALCSDGRIAELEPKTSPIVENKRAMTEHTSEFYTTI
ncbi:hypothetical protein FF1_001923 [Malus domestica]